jgi:MFS-type transporter involved in bile tolerance (Atg22 family)
LCRYSLGSAQAFGRALFSELIPEGHEADMFALFEITDKVGRCKLNSVEP